MPNISEDEPPAEQGWGLVAFTQGHIKVEDCNFDMKITNLTYLDYNCQKLSRLRIINTKKNVHPKKKNNV